MLGWGNSEGLKYISIVWTVWNIPYNLSRNTADLTVSFIKKFANLMIIFLNSMSGSFSARILS